jgi:hypothetical protein
LMRAQSIFKCSPIDGSLETYSFHVGSDTGIACVAGSGTDKMVIYMEKMLPTGERKMAVAATKFNKSRKRHVGKMYRLFPPGPKREFTINTAPGFIVLNYGDGDSIELNLKPDGLPWVPADIRQITGCAMETPQIFLNIVEQSTMQRSKMMLCAMGHNPGSGYEALYGFGMRSSPTMGMEPFFFLGQSISPIVPSAPVNIIANIMEICMRPDCSLCSAGFKSLTLSS